MAAALKKYWIRVETSAHDTNSWISALGYGITAFSREDAIDMLRTEAFEGQPMPEVVEVVEDVDEEEIQKRYGMAKLEAFLWPGIWYPTWYKY